MNQIILDTDPGIDDAVAMVVLLKTCKERVELILSSYGNISVEQTTKNALTMLSLLNVDIPVVKGTAKPDNKKYVDAKHIHGVDGLGGLSLDIPQKKAIEGDYLSTVYKKIVECGTVDYITLGPLTNLALLLKRYPDVKKHISRVVTMGAGIDMGNVTPHAEFNIYCDPYSADYVFKEIDDISVIPLNTSTTVAFTIDQIEEIGKIGTPLTLAMEKILTQNYHNCVNYGEPGSTMHDSTAVLYYLYPELFNVKQCGLDVDCDELFGKTMLNEERKNITLTLDTKESILLSKIKEAIL